MSVPRHHAEWLSLVEAQGAFLSIEELLKVFPQGLDAHEPEHFNLLKIAYDEWSYEKFNPEIHRAWIDWVLENTLEFPEELLQQRQQIAPSLTVKVAQHGESLTPDVVLVEPDTGKPQLLVKIVPFDQGLEKSYKKSRWTASPATRMLELLRGTNINLGLVTNGEQWMLVYAPQGQSSSFISWYSNLWGEEKVTLRAFRSLLGVRRFFAVEAEETLTALFQNSKDSQKEVTDQLGKQVLKAVEVLVQKIDKLDQDRGLLRDVSEETLYESALVVMMRLVFLFCAEEKGLLLAGNSLYDKSYAVSTIREELRTQADSYGEEILERRYDAWCRLLALFRGVHGGIDHHLIQLPAYGGNLFDPKRFPFLEGDDRPLQVDNRTVLHLLEALQILQDKLPGGKSEPRRLSFKGLDVEQIGHIYEGLLDHTAVRSHKAVLGIAGTKNKEPELDLTELEAKYSEGIDSLVKYLYKETKRSKSALKNSVEKEETLDPLTRNKLLIACQNNKELVERVLPFYYLLREDTFGYPLVIPQGSVYVTQGSDRRDTGTHYTSKNVTEEIVRYTLEPLVYEGVAEGKPAEEWQLKPAEELLALNICDFCMGSAAFLVQACRYLGEKLVQAWVMAEANNPGKVVIAPEGKLSRSRPEECMIPVDGEERLIYAKRTVAERCLYGVDKNHLAVEMAKLSLWLETMQKDKPFTFLDHCLKTGDSLVGVNIEQLKSWNLDTTEGTNLNIGVDILWNEVQSAIAKRLQIQSRPVNSPLEQKEKTNLLTEANARIHDLKVRADLLMEVYHSGLKKTEREALRERMLNVVNSGMSIPEGDLKKLPQNLATFHWELEFPEVFFPASERANGDSQIPDTVRGFSALVSNPPFMGSQKITGTLGEAYREYLVDYLAHETRGQADLCSYFFLRANKLVQSNGYLGLVATNTIAQGDTREVGLDQIVSPPVLAGQSTESASTIYRAVPSRTWEGSASLEVAYVWLKKGQWQSEYYLDDKTVTGITPYLTIPGKAVGKPNKLAANQSKSFIGSYVLGMGFVLTPEEAKALIEKDPRNKDVLFPYLNGQDLNSNPDQSPSRWVINFKDWALDEEHEDPKKPKGRPYAADYPDLLKIVEEKVKPERDKNKNKQRREIWWRFTRPTMELYEAIAGRDRVLVRSRVADIHSIAFVPANIVLNERLTVFAFSKYKDLVLLQSNIHEIWARKYSSTLRKDMMYAPTDCFETFPFPESTSNLETIGETYYNHRQAIMQTRQEGLTKTYNRFHDPAETSEDIIKLRQLHVEMDYAVAQAYGWDDLIPPALDPPALSRTPLIKGGMGGLNHDFQETKQGLRYTISELIRREILDRLLQLNFDRYAEEVAQGLHDKKKGKSKKKKKASNSKINQKSLF
ncbi:Eco57I restriction-modification methylase domain-containing protein [Pleurocapsa sp. PCC 7319]|uniref:Eco57I restriction-modification methylase domain-containing protein n=1 Tax=Pleurocapsa sp. PCC 7319 TaxID=118161 RepID=UPI000347EFD0|nr:type IIL restriction-modification enzyme MmeI [Pleurocapsa sp. PCC 7319]